MRGHQGHQPHNDDDDEKVDNEVEDNDKDDDNNDKGISALGLDRDIGFYQGPSYETPNDLIRYAHISQGIE